jgi:hypothetical protein
MKRLLFAVLAVVMANCASVNPDTYKTLGNVYGRTDGWYVDASGNWQQIVNGSATGAYFSSTGDFTTAGAIAYTNFTASGTAAVTGATTLTGDVTMSGAATVVSQTIGIDFASMKIFDSRSTPLTVAASDDDDLTYYEGTFGTNAATLETIDCGGLNDTTQKAVFTFVLPPTYPAGATINLKANVGMRTTVADQGATLDFSCYVADYANEDGTMSGDLIGTAAQSVNSTTFADKTFVLDDDAAGYVLGAGDTIECLVTALCDDDGNAAGGITVVINKLEVVTST